MLPYEYLPNLDLSENSTMAKEKADNVCQYMACYLESSSSTAIATNDPYLSQLVGAWGPAMNVEYAYGRVALPQQQVPSKNTQKQVPPPKKQASTNGWQSRERESRQRQENYVERMITEQLEAFRRDPSSFPEWAEVAEEEGMEEAENQMCEWLGDSYC